MVRVLVAEDSQVVRDHLLVLLGEDPKIKVIGIARNGVEAVALTRKLRPDVVLMDVSMPRMNGYQATREIMTSTPIPIVMISSGFDTGGIATTFDALSAGAVAVVEKPAGGDTPALDEAARQLRETVRLMAEIKVVRRWTQHLATAPKPPANRGPRSAASLAHRSAGIEIAALGASTGGPAALAEILGQTGAEARIPILVVQHIARGFTPGFATWLNDQTALRVKLAEAGEPVQPGVVYLGPDDLQMGVSRGGRIHLAEDPAEDGFRPSISYLFRSLAANYGASALGALLTGMGQDGVAGLLQLHNRGALTLVQDAESSVIFGMAQRAVRLGAAENLLSPTEIAHVLRYAAAHKLARKEA